MNAAKTKRVVITCILLSAFTLLNMVSLNAQTFSWGFPFRLDDEIDYSVEHFEDGDIYRLKSKYDLSKYDYLIQSDRLSTAELERTGTVDLSAINENPIDALKTHQDMYRVDGKEFVFFSSEYIGETKATKLYWQSVNIDSGERTGYTELSSVEGKGTINLGRFETAQSPDGSYFAVLKIPAFYKKEQESVVIEVYDANFNKVHEVNHVFDRLAKRGPLYSVHVGNDGEVYLISQLDLKKQLPHVEVYTAGLTDSSLEVHSLKQDDNFQLVQNFPYFVDNDFYLVSMVSITGASEIQIRPDYDGRTLGARGSGLLMTKFSEGKALYQKRTDFENSITNLRIKDILPSDAGHYVITEQMYVAEKSSSSDLTSTDVRKDYTYLNDGFLVALFDESNGMVDWFYRIQIAEPDTKNDNGAYLSVLPLIKGSMLVLLYNETRDVPNSRNTGTKRRRFPIIEVISSEGETVRKEALLAAGVGVEYDEKIELDTSVIYPLTENKFLVRGRSNAEFKYGYLTF